ncbi:eukaryotic translation initiation factor 2 subunit alpha homolog [Brassica rapa]|nr:eukaryotic translation initiation factor 2 subunit alpha homolog [Brassica rapa]
MLLKTVSSSSAAREFPWRNQGRFSSAILREPYTTGASSTSVSDQSPRYMAFQSDASGTELYVNIGYRKHGHAFELSLCCLQDPDSVLGSLTREIKEVGPDGQEVTKVVPAVTEEDQGIEILTEAIAACTETIDQHKGKLVVKEAPRAVKHMAKLRMDNEEISGNEEEEEDTGMGEVDIEGAGIVE